MWNRIFIIVFKIYYGRQNDNEKLMMQDIYGVNSDTTTGHNTFCWF